MKYEVTFHFVNGKTLVEEYDEELWKMFVKFLDEHRWSKSYVNNLKNGFYLGHCTHFEAKQICKKNAFEKEKMKQKIIIVNDAYYSDLVVKIEDWINTLEDTYEIQQIDYFNMSEKDNSPCTAIILFKPIN